MGVQATHQNDPVRHYNLVCHVVRENPLEPSSLTRPKAPEPVGYVYFRVYDGNRETQLQQRSPTTNPTIDLTEDAYEPSNGYVVISHIKVSSLHQKRGVATLLLASVVQFVEKERKGIRCGGFYLSVAVRNRVAIAFYEKLGFRLWDGIPQQDGWVGMRRLVPPSRLPSVWKLWLSVAWDERRELSHLFMQQ